MVLSRFSIFLIICAPRLRADKAGATETTKPPVWITIQGLRDERAAQSCLGAMNRNRKRPFAIPENGEGEYQIVVERRRPGYLVRIEKMGTSLKSGRALFDYELCIAAAAVTRDIVADD